MLHNSMAREAIIFFIIVLVFPPLIKCNLEGDVLHIQKLEFIDPFKVLQSWDPTLVNPCTWAHVTCNNFNSVVRVDLGNAGLSGHLVPQLGLLSNLQYLELYENKISGVIPSSLGNLTKLVSLDLWSNQFSGSIPSSLGDLLSLRYLRLHGNELTGSIPESVLKLTVYENLKILNVSDNNLEGTTKASPKRVTTIIQDRLKFAPH